MSTPEIVPVFYSTAGVEPEWCTSTDRWGGTVVDGERCFSFVLTDCDLGLVGYQYHWLGLLLGRKGNDFRFACLSPEEIMGWSDVERIVVANFPALARQFETTENAVLEDGEFRVELVSPTKRTPWRQEEGEYDFSPLAMIQKVGHPPFFLHMCTGDYESQDYEVVRTLSMEGVLNLGLWRVGALTYSCENILRWLHTSTTGARLESLDCEPEVVRAVIAGESVIEVTRELTANSNLHRVGKSLRDTARHWGRPVRVTFILPDGTSFVRLFERQDTDDEAAEKLAGRVITG